MSVRTASFIKVSRAFVGAGWNVFKASGKLTITEVLASHYGNTAPAALS